MNKYSKIKVFNLKLKEKFVIIFILIMFMKRMRRIVRDQGIKEGLRNKKDKEGLKRGWRGLLKIKIFSSLPKKL